MVHKDDVIRRLREAASAIERRNLAVANTRDLIIEFAADLAHMVSGLPADDVGKLGLCVHVSARGLVPNPPAKLTIEELPAMPEDDLEARPGAVSAFLEAFGEGTDRIYFELRSNPGTLVCAIVGADDENARRGHSYETTRDWYKDISGVAKRDGQVVLVRYENREGDVAKGPEPAEYLSGFLQFIEMIADERARFNQGDRLR